MREVNILGMPYTVCSSTDLMDTGLDGECCYYSKRIKIRPWSKMLDDTASDLEKQSRYREVVRHEIVHAFLYESGLSEYAQDEQLVDWIAMQFPKIEDAIIEAVR